MILCMILCMLLAALMAGYWFGRALGVLQDSNRPVRVANERVIIAHAPQGVRIIFEKLKMGGIVTVPDARRIAQALSWFADAHDVVQARKRKESGGE